MAEANEDGQAGPLWWGTLNLSTETSEWFLLFEYFTRNENAHGLFRVSLADGTSAWQNLFTYDQLFSMEPVEPDVRGNCINPFIALCEIIGPISKGEEGKAAAVPAGESTKAASSFVNVNCDPQKQNVNIKIQSMKLRRPIYFHMTNEHPMQDFIEQVMTYMSNTQISLQNITKNVQDLQKLHDDELVKLNSAVLEKKQHDEKLQTGTKILMLEKHRHAHSRG